MSSRIAGFNAGDLPILRTSRLTLFIPGPPDAERCVAYRRQNAEHLRPWEPLANDRAFDLEVVRESCARRVEDALAGRRYSFAIVETGSVDGTLLGWANISEIVRGVFQACYLGYSLAAAVQGRGYMTEALYEVIRFAFDDLGLHRIMANYMPRNARSAAVLRRIGFTIEGFARDYLHIAGRWEDHILTSLTNPEAPPPT
jgi:ribosomal-protein-alanine N-acetyltransferase